MEGSEAQGSARGRLADRVAGAILLVLAAAFWWQAGAYSVAFGDPAGPSLFPRVVAVPLGLLSLFLIVRPDPNPDWPGLPAGLRMGAAVAVLLVYPQIIEPLGFPAATFLASLPLALILGAGWQPAVAVSAAIGAGLYVVFDLVFGLPLPAGPFL
ncbi:MAG: tripartite tricarboxylate transporter TctB family protein [Paracoccaceae bacterium]